MISGDLSENSQHVTVKDNGEILSCDKDKKIDLGPTEKESEPASHQTHQKKTKEKKSTVDMVALGGSIASTEKKSDSSDWVT